MKQPLRRSQSTLPRIPRLVNPSAIVLILKTPKLILLLLHLLLIIFHLLKLLKIVKKSRKIIKTILLSLAVPKICKIKICSLLYVSSSLP